MCHYKTTYILLYSILTITIIQCSEKDDSNKNFIFPESILNRQVQDPTKDVQTALQHNISLPENTPSNPSNSSVKNTFPYFILNTEHKYVPLIDPNDNPKPPMALQYIKKNLSQSSPGNTPPQETNTPAKGNTPPKQRNEKTPPKEFIFHATNFVNSPTGILYREQTTTNKNNPHIFTFITTNLSAPIELNFEAINTKSKYNKTLSDLRLNDNTKCFINCNLCNHKENDILLLAYQNMQVHQRTNHCICACNTQHATVQSAFNCPDCQ